MDDSKVTSDFGSESGSEMPQTPKLPKRNGKKTEIVVIIVGLIFAFGVLGAILGDDEENSGVQDSQAVSENTNDSGDNKSKEQTKEEKAEKRKRKKKSKKQMKAKYIKSCKYVKYKKVLRNPDKYEGKKIKALVKIINVDDGLFLKSYIGKDQKGKYYGINEEREKETPRLYKGDTIMAYGSICGLTEIESYIQTGSKVLNYLQEKKEKTVVDMDLKYAKLIK